MQNEKFESNLRKITRPVAAIKSLRFSLLFSDLHWHREHFYWKCSHKYAAMVLRVNSEMVNF